MASFFSFVYRRQSSAPASFQSSSSSAVVSPGEPRLSLRSKINEPRQFLPPGVTSSGSSESAGYISHGISGDSSDDERFMSSPFTPEGLLPRKSADSLRRELKLSPRALEPTMNEKKLTGVAKILAGMEQNPRTLANDASNDHIRQYSEDEEDMILPPPDYLQRRQPTFDSSIKSPMVSTSSFYSRSSRDRPVAMSPVLQVGQARTAVGALVALREAANRHPNASMALDSTNEASAASFEFPKPTKEPKQQPQQPLNRSFSMSVLPPRTDFAENNEAEDENVPYMPVNTPVRRSVSEIPRNISNDDDDDMYASPSSMQLPVDHFEPLSEAARKGMDTSFSTALMTQDRHQIYDFNAIDTQSSKSSLISLGKVEESVAEGGAEHYDFDNQDGLDGALMARKYRNQQMRKQMQQEEDVFAAQDVFEDEYVDEEEEEEVDYDDNPDCGAVVAHDEDNYPVQESMCVNFEEALMRRKRRNQRHEKEAFLHDVVARLRDNLDLVTDIENAASSTVAAMGSWFVKTPMDEENLLTGFSGEERNTLLGSVDSILQEMEVAQPEEFMLSPSKVPVMGVTHDTLTQALHFCRALVASAIPYSEKHKMAMDLPSGGQQYGPQRLFVWKCLPELHFALGLHCTPEPRHSSRWWHVAFSLPEESGAETPHTSNVSMATSITSAYTPHRRRLSSQPMRPQLILQQDGLQLRHTVEVVASLLQKLSMACAQLKELNSTKKVIVSAQTYVRACDEIKQIYLQLLTIKKEDVRALTETFYLESLTPQFHSLLAREVSADEEDAKVAEKTAQVVALASALAPTQQENKQRYESGSSKTRSILRGNSSLDRVNLFSPSTEDMRSKATVDDVPYEFDDLRRQVGSYDREDNCDDEEREGPSLDDYGSRDSEESEWNRRMYQNVSIAASSLRSIMGKQARE